MRFLARAEIDGKRLFVRVGLKILSLAGFGGTGF
jgi:hypothetical protein